MDLEFNEAQKMLEKTARDFLAAECPETLVREMETSEKGYSPELWKKIAELGWLGIPFPEKYDGIGGDILDLVALHKEMARAIFPSPYLSTVVLCGLTILAAGSEEQKAEILPRIAKGELILALALTEPSASWDADGVNVSATAEGDEYIINGTKLFVHDAHIADYLLCVARTKNGAAPEEGITLFLVDAKSPGISYTVLKTIARDKPSEVTFNKVKVPKKNMIGELHKGWAPVAKVLQQGTVLVCAQMVGMSEVVLEKTLEYASTRIQFDAPIGINQHVQEHCIVVAMNVEGIRWATYKAAWKLNAGLPSEYEVAVAKAWCSDAIEEACLRAHSLWAGASSMHEYGFLPLYTRRAKSAQLYLGDSAHHRNRIAQIMDNWTLEIPKGKPLGLWDTMGLDESERVWPPPSDCLPFERGG